MVALYFIAILFPFKIVMPFSITQPSSLPLLISESFNDLSMSNTHIEFFDFLRPIAALMAFSLLFLTLLISPMRGEKKLYLILTYKKF